VRFSKSCLIILAIASACSKKEAPPTPPAAVAVETARAQAIGQSTSILATGKLEREREVALSFRSGGILNVLTVDNGDAVRRGQLIAVIDPTEFDARLRRADADYDKAKRDASRDADLAKQGWVSGQRMADRNTVVKSSKANLDAARFDLQKTKIYAQTSGIVLVRHAQAGETVAPGQPIVTIADMSAPLVVRVALVDRDVARIKVGDPARIKVAALENYSVAGVVSQVGQRADPRTGATDVEIRVPNDSKLKTGFVADAQITLRSNAVAEVNKLRVPAEAILEVDAGKGYVFTVDPKTSKARRLAVAFYGFEGDDAVIGGLQPNQKVITFGAALVRDGQTIADNTLGN
jgi:membrane fusion protein, multidrug efflux system